MERVFQMIFGIVAGFVTAFVLVNLTELFSSIVHPLPPDFKGTMEEMCQQVANYPTWVLGVVVPLWGFTAFAGTWVAGRVGNLGSAGVLAVLLLYALGCNLSMLPYPLWFKIAQPIAVVIAIAAACVLVSRRSPLLESQTPA
ncbi:hypothetical protein [Planctomicrobium piriforme]|uniref:Uncharacterized protein n=1 Tax=Planctomicrobium piriforme TaxID=1576369 RepID=A0A1I3F2D3_9PLAN|nr:hypothetical protein [Planctomicrobium piriforme]SFI05399.1 hypothetical protein SAMN05421753_10553 [Planctomicrobium piriforme]